MGRTRAVNSYVRVQSGGRIFGTVLCAAGAFRIFGTDVVQSGGRIFGTVLLCAAGAFRIFGTDVCMQQARFSIATRPFTACDGLSDGYGLCEHIASPLVSM